MSPSAAGPGLGGTLITGATGFLGHHVLQALSAQPELRNLGPIWLLVRDAAAWRASDDAASMPWAQPIVAALDDAAAIQSALRGAPLARVLHLAAAVHHGRDKKHTEATYKANVQGTQAIIDVCHGAGARLVVVSTSGTVGCSRHAAARPDESAPFCAAAVRNWPYYASKIEAEKCVQRAMEEGLEAVIVRPPVMLGPGDSRFRATSLIVRFLRRKLPFYLSGGMHFIDVRDAAQALLQALTHPAPKPIYHLPGAQMSLAHYFNMLAQVSGVPAPKYCLPHPLAWALAYAAAGKLVDPVLVEMGRNHWGISSKYAHELGYTCRDPLLTLQETVAYVRAHHPSLR